MRAQRAMSSERRLGCDAALRDARARLGSDGRLEVASGTADIGTGTYTIMTRIAADALVVGVAAAVANAVFHATGVRVRELLITIDKLL